MDEQKYVLAILGQLSMNSWKRSGVVVRELREQGYDMGDRTIVYLIELGKRGWTESKEGEALPEEVMQRGSWHLLEWKLTQAGKKRLELGLAHKTDEMMGMPSSA